MLCQLWRVNYTGTSNKSLQFIHIDAKLLYIVIIFFKTVLCFFNLFVFLEGPVQGDKNDQ